MEWLALVLMIGDLHVGLTGGVERRAALTLFSSTHDAAASASEPRR